MSSNNCFIKLFYIYKNVLKFISQILSRKKRKTTKKARERYQSLSEEKKQKKKQQCGRERCKTR